MKIEIDRNGRKLYKFSSSISQGGYMYAHKTVSKQIKDKEGLRNALTEVVKKLELIDTTIKVYDNIFFLFFMMKPSITPQRIIDEIIYNRIHIFANWSNEFVYTEVYDLQEKYVRKDIEKIGFDFSKGYMW